MVPSREELFAQIRNISAHKRKKVQPDPKLREEANQKRRKQYKKRFKETRGTKKKWMTKTIKKKQQKYWRDFKRVQK